VVTQREEVEDSNDSVYVKSDVVKVEEQNEKSKTRHKLSPSIENLEYNDSNIVNHI